jgi:acetylornithine deacetylase/succinyl-diaminopimelate desuccinylase-like protein
LQQAQEILQKVVDTSYVEGTTATIKDVSMRPPFFKNEQTQKLFDQMQSISQKYNLGVLVPVESGGGSDSCYTQAGGVASLCGLGGCGQNVHTTKEFIVLESIEQRAKMLSAFCVEF